jgi:hypothetical protein
MRGYSKVITALAYFIMLNSSALLGSDAQPKALAGQTEVSRIISPDGTQVAYGQFVVGPKGKVTSRIIVCAVDGTQRRVVPVELERVHEVLWFSQECLA